MGALERQVLVKWGKHAHTPQILSDCTLTLLVGEELVMFVNIAKDVPVIEFLLL